MNLFIILTQKVIGIAGNDNLYFDTSISVKSSPHLQSFKAWGVCVSPAGKTFVMDYMRQWYEVTEKDQLLISSLLQRILQIEKQLNKVA